MNGQAINILLVEDNPGDARLVKEMLTGDGLSPTGQPLFELTHVGRLSQAHDALAQKLFDLILLDLSLPDGHGLTTVSQMHDAAPDIAIVVMSGLNDEAIAIKAVQEGAQDYLVKGQVDGFSLSRALRYAIERKRIEIAEREQRELAEALRDIIAALNSTLKLDEVLDRILANVGRVVPHDTANIMLIESGVAHVAGGRGYAEPHRPSMVGKRFTITQLPTLKQMVDTGQSLIIPDTSQDPTWVDMADTRWIRSYVATPICIREEIVGFINLASSISGFYNDIHAKRLQAFAEQTGVAISNASLLEAEREQRLVAETLTEVTLALTSRVSHTEVLDEILRQVQRLAPFQAANIMLLEGNTLRIARWQGYESFGGDAFFPHLVQSLTLLPIDAWVVQTRQAVVIPDTAQDSRWVVFNQTAWIRSHMCAPICLRDRVLGVLRLDSNIVGQFSPNDAARLHPLANAAAIALENARLFDAEARRRREAETLREATVALTSALDLKQVLDSILMQLQQVMPYNSASVLLLEGDRLQVVASQGAFTIDQIIGHNYPATADALFAEMQRTLGPLYLPDAAADPRYRSQGDMDQAYGWMGVPLITRGRVIGYLRLNGAQVAAYGQSEAMLAQAFAGQASVAIENARLFEQTQSVLAQTEALYQFARSLIVSESVSDLLQAVANSVAQILPANRVLLVVCDLEAKQILHYFRGGSDASQIGQIPFAELWEGLVGWVIREFKPALSPKGIPDPRESEIVQRRRQADQTGAILAVPLYYRAKALGAIVAINRPDQRDFTPQDKELLVAMTNQAAVAIENVRLFEATRQHLTDLEALRQASLSVASSLDLETVLEAILESANLLTGLQDAQIYLYQDDELTFGAALWIDSLAQPPKESAPNDLLYAVARQGTSIVIPNRRDQSAYTAVFSGREGAAAGLPLKIGERVVGVMNVEYQQPRVWPESELRALRLLADQAAVAIENARLYKQAQQEIEERIRAEAKLNEYRARLEELVWERTAELQHALSEAADARDKINAILQSVADGLIVTDPDYRVILANPAAEKLLGVELKEMLDHEVGAGIKNDRLRAMIHAVFEQRSGDYEIDLEAEDPHDTRQRVLRARTAPVDDHEGHPLGAVTIIQDVTRLREIDRLKTELLTTTAHELRTPLTSILGFSEILLNRDLKPERRQHYLSRIYEQSTHLSKIIADLVDLSRIEAGHGMELKLEKVNLTQLMNDIVTPYTEKTTQHHLCLEGLNGLPLIYGDPFRLTQVGQNIISNAINYSPQGGQIIVRGRVIANYIEISIQDHGIGITPEQQKQVFKPFYRAQISHTAVGGSGLGLATSKLIIEQHGGQIWIESAAGVGTTVYFTLPLPLPEESKI